MTDQEARALIERANKHWAIKNNAPVGGHPSNHYSDKNGVWLNFGGDGIFQFEIGKGGPPHNIKQATEIAKGVADLANVAYELKEALSQALDRLELAEKLERAAHEFNEKVADIVSWEQHDTLSGLGSDLSTAIQAWRSSRGKS